MMADIDPIVAEGKIHQALTRLGISFLDAMSIVAYDPEAQTAYWSYEIATGKQRICVGPTIASMDISSIEMVLRHEFLHRATYNGFHERFEDSNLLNVVEDVCINRLLFEAYPEKMTKLSMQVYSEEAKKTIIALADCSADPGLLDKSTGNLWKHVWEPDELGNFNPLNPTSLYFRLVEIRDTVDIQIVFEIPIFAPHSDLPPLSDEMREKINTVLASIAGNLVGTGSSTVMMNTLIDTGFQFDTSKITRFMQSLRVDTLVSAVRNDLIETSYRTFTAPYPMFPSRLGLIYSLTGISELTGLYNNIQKIEQPVQLKLCFYVDVSGSMEEFFKYTHHFVKAVFDIPLKVRIFDTSIRDISVEEYTRGEFSVGGGTDFDIVLEDLMQDDSIGAGLMFTDGEATVDPNLIRAFQRSGKKLHIVYFTSNNSLPDSMLNSVCSQTLVMPVG